jgi:hypothetical protein
LFCLKLLIETTAGKNATDLVFDYRGSVTHIMAALDASNVSYMSTVSGVKVAIAFYSPLGNYCSVKAHQNFLQEVSYIHIHRVFLKVPTFEYFFRERS